LKIKAQEGLPRKNYWQKKKKKKKKEVLLERKSSTPYHNRTTSVTKYHVFKTQAGGDDRIYIISNLTTQTLRAEC